MRTFTLILMITILLLSGCNLPTSPRPSGDGTATAEANQVATQVQEMLNKAPTSVAATVASAPTQAPAATSTPAPTATKAPAPTQAKPTPTTPSGDPKNSLGAATWTTKFESDKGYHLYDNGNTKVAYEPGALLLTGLQANGWLGWTLITSKPSQNFYLEGTFQTQTCSGADVYGVVFRAPNTDSGYFFGITCDGKYNLHARNFTDNSDAALIQSTAESAIVAGSDQVNRLGVLANGSDFKLYVNGTLVKETSDGTFPNAGSFGGFVAANSTAGFTVKLTQISLWQLP